MIIHVIYLLLTSPGAVANLDWHDRRQQYHNANSNMSQFTILENSDESTITND